MKRLVRLYVGFKKFKASKNRPRLSFGGIIINIIIDGYNVIGVFHRDIKKAREDFIDMLVQYRSLKTHNITVVFDGHKNGDGVEHVTVRGGVKIIYSRLRERADDVIKGIISNERRKWIVISSDREIINHAWSMDSIPINSDRFLKVISNYVDEKYYSRVPILNEETNEEDEFEDPRLRKGNPRRLSRKQKSVIRALSKL
ncbi:NYN domain-containing protein [Thermodesulfovibrionales bacterium]|nr:NYN domain-containing protein [Thermodesulfovibrionales bacterium]MCL0041095.1 NYN domain-containing protein [Thermodesulfovibrionales bacterium]MCL0083879.1 NYN domain-containing protein [Thermodesulfovibrionales bacterium]MCL0086687.1 NYN domain-containing protein [Thermodesulfovibrionales bacterium]MCL0096863.1 NYN domain-containing protein [Thermodesulfovibrionales bacterium]